MVFGVGLEYFFIADKERPLIAITRKAERLRFPEQQGTQDETYTFESLNFPVTDRKLDGYLAEFSIDSKPSESHSHEGIELVFVMKGALAITINGEDQLLGEGDAIYFDSGSPHSYRRTGKSTCSAIIVTT